MPARLCGWRAPRWGLLIQMVLLIHNGVWIGVPIFLALVAWKIKVGLSEWSGLVTLDGDSLSDPFVYRMLFGWSGTVGWRLCCLPSKHAGLLSYISPTLVGTFLEGHRTLEEMLRRADVDKQVPQNLHHSLAPMVHVWIVCWETLGKEKSVKRIKKRGE